MQQNKYYWAGTLTTVLRLVVGWTYFSAFWRRLILENKLDPDQAGYIGEKFNHFLPHALGIKPLIDYLVTNPSSLWWAMAIFTAVEGIIGLFLMLGLFTRLSAIGTMSLALGILLGSGWIGTTCLDEWQIGVLGISAGFVILLTGSGSWSLDHWLLMRSLELENKKWFRLLASGAMNIKEKSIHRLSIIGALIIFALTLFTNQYFHGGVYGELHNKSVKPKLEITNLSEKNNAINFELMRIEGADVYGSFLIAIELLDKDGNVIKTWNQDMLANQSDYIIENKYVAKVKPGAHSLVIPLGAKAEITLMNTPSTAQSLRLVDISGLNWRENF